MYLGIPISPREVASARQTHNARYQMQAAYARVTEKGADEGGYSNYPQEYMARRALEVSKVRHRAPVPGVLFDVSALPFV